MNDQSWNKAADAMQKRALFKAVAKPIGKWLLSAPVNHAIAGGAVGGYLGDGDPAAIAAGAAAGLGGRLASKRVANALGKMDNAFVRRQALMSNLPGDNALFNAMHGYKGDWRALAKSSPKFLERPMSYNLPGQVPVNWGAKTIAEQAGNAIGKETAGLAGYGLGAALGGTAGAGAANMAASLANYMNQKPDYQKPE